MVLADPISRKVNICIFDCMNNVAWKNETVAVPGHDPVNIGPHWPVLFGPDRTPKRDAVELLHLWEKSRGR